MAGGAALAAVDSLTVKGRAPKTGYDRDRFGSAWADTDSNKRGTRDDILKRDLVDVRFRSGGCVVAAGKLDPDPYSGEDVTFTRGRSEVDIDHIVALSDAWQKGAKYWDASKRIALANDPLNLRAVDASTNRSKGDGDTASWLPPNKAIPLHLCRQPGRREEEVRTVGHGSGEDRDEEGAVGMGRAETAGRRQPDGGACAVPRELSLCAGGLVNRCRCGRLLGTAAPRPPLWP